MVGEIYEVEERKDGTEQGKMSADTTSSVLHTRRDSDTVLDLSYYRDLFEFIESIYDEIYEEEVDINTVYEKIFDYYGAYEIDCVRDAYEKLGGREGKYAGIGDILFRLEIEGVPLRRLMLAYDKAVQEDEKKQILDSIDSHLEKLFTKYSFLFWNGYEEREMTRNMMYWFGQRGFISFSLDGWSMNTFVMEELALFLQRVQFENKVSSTIGSLDQKNLKKETLKYGAKGANLRIVSDLLKKVGEISWRLEDQFYVPDFDIIPVSLYDKWIVGEEISSELESYYDSIQGKKAILRSSAVYSEDGENSTGAGIYESIVLEAGVSFSDFQNAVEEIYASVNSQRAVAYREEQGISNEKMGIVVQDLVEEESVKDDVNMSFVREKGYINTFVKGVPRLMDMVLSKGMRPVIDKEALIKKYAGSHEDGSIFYYQVDTKKWESINSIESLALCSYLFEQYYGSGLQIEFITSEFYAENYGSEKKHAIVQSRFLPSNYGEVRSVDFPEKETLFEGRALGIGDVQLDVLPNWEDNSQREGIVIFESSKFASMNAGMQEYNIPHSGVVIILGKSRENMGHIETLCAEKGLLLVFNEGYIPSYDTSGDVWGKENMRCHTDNLGGHKKLRIVMDGLVGKVYAI